MTELQKDDILEVAKYENLFRGKTFVIKVGGDAFEDDSKYPTLLKDIHDLHTLGIQIILVHGAGPQTNEEIQKRGLSIKKINGLRVTNEDVLQCVEKAQKRVNKLIINSLKEIQSASDTEHYDIVSLPANGEIKAIQDCNPLLGSVGKIDSINVHYFADLFAERKIGVVHSMGYDDEGNTYNVNADHMAERLAKFLGAEHLIMITKSGGCFKNFGKQDQVLISKMDVIGAKDMLDNTHDLDGMEPKLKYIIDALQGDLVSAHIIGQDDLFKEIFTSKGAGTMVVRDLTRPPLQKTRLAEQKDFNL